MYFQTVQADGDTYTAYTNARYQFVVDYVHRNPGVKSRCTIDGARRSSTALPARPPASALIATVGSTP